MYADILFALEWLLVPAVILVAVCSVPAIVASRYVFQVRDGITSTFLVACAFLGAVPGIIAGGSMQPLVQALLTGLIGLASSLMLYLLGKEATKNWRKAVPMALIVLLVSTLGGLAIGAAYKKQFTSYERLYQRRMLLYEKVDLPVCKEERLMALQGKAVPNGYRGNSCPTEF